MIKLAIRNNLIKKLKVHRLKKEKFIKILETEYNFNISDIIKTLLLDKIEIIINRDVLEYINILHENIYYDVHDINYDTLDKINFFINEHNDIKEILIKLNIIIPII